MTAGAADQPGWTRRAAGPAPSPGLPGAGSAPSAGLPGAGSAPPAGLPGAAPGPSPGLSTAGPAPSADPDAAPYAAALAGLPGAGPTVLVRILRDWTPEEAWRRIRDGRLRRLRPGPKRGDAQLGFELGRADFCPPEAERADPVTDPAGGVGLDESWRHVARSLDPPAWWARFAARGVGLTWPGQPDYPSALVTDPQQPGVLFWRGALCHLTRPCVAIVGTRRASPDGRSVAFELGRDLAEAGICVVSGLALGIDGAAHAGALSVRRSAGTGTAAAGPAGVAASGVDVPYPRRHTGLWEQVVQSGVMVSETLPGRPAEAWRFPARNRIIAALVSMVVVVESHETGGSLITAEAAIARGVDVRAVPGPVHSSASAGSNQLLYDGPGPVRNAQDVLDGLGIFVSSRARPSGRALSVTPPHQAHPARDKQRATAATMPAGTHDTTESLSAEARRVLDAISWQPTPLAHIVDRSGLPVATASRALDSLESAGLVTTHGQWWVRRSQR